MMMERESSQDCQKPRCAVHPLQRFVETALKSRFVIQFSMEALPRKETTMSLFVGSSAT
jgi:hypothetical protein